MAGLSTKPWNWWNCKWSIIMTPLNTVKRPEWKYWVRGPFTTFCTASAISICPDNWICKKKLPFLIFGWIRSHGSEHCQLNFPDSSNGFPQLPKEIWSSSSPSFIINFLENNAIIDGNVICNISTCQSSHFRPVVHWLLPRRFQKKLTCLGWFWGSPDTFGGRAGCRGQSKGHQSCKLQKALFADSTQY